MPYPYQNIPLTPPIVAHLALELFAGRTTARDQIVREVVRVHTERGGKKTSAQNILTSVTRGLALLRKQKKAENPSTGFWKIFPRDSVQQDVVDKIFSETQAADAEEANLLAESLLIDDGSGSVYLYYLPLYRKDAERENKKIWPCKIGKSGSDPTLRILSQAATALPEPPEVAVIFDTKHTSALETALHSILILKDRKIEGSPGTEWFLTSPEEIITIAATIDPGIKPRAETGII